MKDSTKKTIKKIFIAIVILVISLGVLYAVYHYYGKRATEWVFVGLFILALLFSIFVGDVFGAVLDLWNLDDLFVMLGIFT